MRTSYVQINGQLYEKTGDNRVIIAGEPWVLVGNSWQPESQLGGWASMVMPDIQPYKSTIDGSVITSRSRHREHLRAHNCIEVGNEPPRAPVKDFRPKNLRAELIARLGG